MKRMCIKALPPVLVIQLKRFGYDWEAGRALKFDDHFEVIYSFSNCIMRAVIDQTLSTRKHTSMASLAIV